MSEVNAVKKKTLGDRFAEFKAMEGADKRRAISGALINNAMYIIIAIAVIFIAVKVPAFIKLPSIINIISLTAAKLPIALGIGGAIVLTGTDISAGRCVGLTACIAASLLQVASYSNKMFPNLGVMPLWLVFLIVVAVGALVGLVNGFFVAKFKLHPFIVTLSTQLITYGLYLTLSNAAQISNLDASYTSDLVIKPMFRLGNTPVMSYVAFAIIVTAIMWFIWNKTTFGKNMFALGANEEAARVSGVNVFATNIMVFALAGAMYAVTGFIEGARVASNTANTGLNYESDAIAACVIGGVSFVGGIGKISGVVLGVVLMQLIMSGMTFLGISGNTTYIIKGLVILIACAIDMRKYLTKK